MVAALVLSAGLGTRLLPLTLDRPKSLVPIGDRPALAHVLDRVEALGCGPIAVNAHHHAEALDAFALESARFLVSREEELLGTAGGLAFALPRLGAGDVILWNGDIFADLPPALLAASPSAAASLVVQPVAAESLTRGNVGLAADGRIVRLRGTTAPAAPPETSSANFLGVQRLGAELARTAPARGCLVGDLYIPALLRGERIEARATDAPWIDVGSPAAYLAANLAWLGGRSSFVAEPAAVATGVTLRASIVGRGARVEGAAGSVLERVVVWPGATARAPLTNAVVTPSRVVAVPSDHISPARALP